MAAEDHQFAADVLERSRQYYVVKVVLHDPTAPKALKQYSFPKVFHHRMVDRWLIVTHENGEQIFPADRVVTAIVEKQS